MCEDQQIFREFRSEAMQMKASAVPPNLTTDFEAMVESKKYEIQSPQRNSWVEANPMRFKVSMLMKVLAH